MASITMATNREAEKAGREREIFTEFAATAGLRLVPGSIVSRPVPEPDILCQLEGQGAVAFELVELIDEGLARSISCADGSGVWVGDRTLEMVRTKLKTKKYETEYPLELLAYADIDLLLPEDVWMPGFEQLLVQMLNGSAFRRLWVFVSAASRKPARIRFVHPSL